MSLPKNNQAFKAVRWFAELLLRSPVKESDFVRKAVRFVTERSKVTQGLPARACHLYRLAVDSKGDVYPCCMVYRSAYHKIGNIRDPDLAQAIDSYERTCSCDVVKLRKKNNEDPTGDERILNLELSLVCQAECAMCCVGAPDWAGKYDRYAELTQLIRSQKPDSIVMQGGEVLIQPRSLDWAREIKSEFPRTKLRVVTNGNLEATMAPTLSGLFDSFVISFVGFQPETYRTIMGLDLGKTLAFAKALIEQRASEVTLKFLITPLGIHEVAQFIGEALQLQPNNILVAESGTRAYIVADTPDRFWGKIVDRSSRAVKRALCSAKDSLDRHDVKVHFETAAASLLDVHDAFLRSNGLETRVFTHW